MNRKTLIGIAILCLAILLLVGGYRAVHLFRQPQAPTLSLVMPVVETPTITSALLPTSTQAVPSTSSPATATPKPTPTKVNTVTPTEAPKVCGQTGSWTVMILGRSSHTALAGAQSIRLLMADFDQQSVKIYSIPSALVVDTPGLVEDYGIQYAYFENIFPEVVKRLGEKEGSDFFATQAVAQVILDNFGILLKHYITIRIDVVAESIDAIGGIDVDLPEDFEMPADSKYKGQVLKAGRQHFDGEMLYGYVSAVNPGETEFDRLNRQNVVMAGIQRKMLDPTTYLKIIELYSLYKENIVTDLSLEQMTSLGCLARQVPRDQIMQKSPEQSELIYWTDGTMHLKDLDSTTKMLQEFFDMK